MAIKSGERKEKGWEKGETVKREEWSVWGEEENGKGINGHSLIKGKQVTRMTADRTILFRDKDNWFLNIEWWQIALPATKGADMKWQ